jgi:hypothetical protein
MSNDVSNYVGANDNASNDVSNYVGTNDDASDG